MTIPKKIHYCWFGRSPKTPLINKCIQSWKLHLPDYEIKEWNEDNFDLNISQYTSQAYSAKKWAFVSDFVRLYALHEEGGIYLDTDVEILKSLDEFLVNEAFTGFEANDSPFTAVFGAVKSSSIVTLFLDSYKERNFIRNDGTLDFMTNTTSISDILLKMGIKPNGKFQKLDNISIYPQIYFCPNNLTRIWNKPSNKSFAIHHFDQSWKETDLKRNNSLKKRLRRYLVGKIRNILGTDFVANLGKRLH